MSKKLTFPNPSVPTTIIKYYIFELIKLVKITSHSILKDPTGINRKNIYSKLISYKGSGQGKECFVFANGPSLKKLDPLKIANYKKKEKADIFCVNYFIKSTFAQISGADYLILSDPKSFTNEDGIMTIASQKITKGVFMPVKYIDRMKGKLNIPIIGFNDTETSYTFSNSIDPTFPRSYISMSAYKALALAIFGGYSTIYIIGFDNTFIHNLRCDEKNRIFRINEHFDKQSYPNDHNIQYLDYKNRTVTDEILAYSQLFHQLRKFNSYNIINLDINSLTDAFPKDDSLDIYI